MEEEVEEGSRWVSSCSTDFYTHVFIFSLKIFFCFFFLFVFGLYRILLIVNELLTRKTEQIGRSHKLTGIYSENGLPRTFGDPSMFNPSAKDTSL